MSYLQQIIFLDLDFYHHLKCSSLLTCESFDPAFELIYYQSLVASP